MAREPQSLLESLERLFIIAAASTLMVVALKWLMRFLPSAWVITLLVAGLVVLMMIRERQVQRVRFTDAGIDPQDGSPLMLWRDVVSVDSDVGPYRNIALFVRGHGGRIITLATPLTWSTNEMLEVIREQVGPEVTMNGEPFGGHNVSGPQAPNAKGTDGL